MNSVLKAFISRSALRHNARLIMARTGGVPLCAVVKADAYGHDADIVARCLSGTGVAFWGVAALEEALALRAAGVSEPILLFRPVGAYSPESELRESIKLMSLNGIRATVTDEAGLTLLTRCLRDGEQIRVHLKVDTGMGRNGCSHPEAAKLAIEAGRTPRITLEGIYSHFACADEPDPGFSNEQMAVFRGVTEDLDSRGLRVPIKHMANSAAVFNLPAARFDMIRPGLALYGYGGQHVRDSGSLVPALKMTAPLVLVKNVRKGASCGYGRAFIAGRDSRIGLLPAGYADGYSRRMSNLGVVGLRGRLAPVIGRVSMDLTIIDLTDIPGAAVGDEVCIISNIRGDPHSVESMAAQLDTIPYEITSVLGKRVKRIEAE